MLGPLKVFSGRASRYLGEEICSHLGLPMGETEVTKFANDNLFVRVLENVRECDVFVVQTSCPPVDENLMEMLILIDALKRASAARITAVTPLFPYARSDKKDQPRVAITARLVADMIQVAGASRVVTIDLHADQIQGFFNSPVDHLSAQALFAGHFRQGDLTGAVVVAPDPGMARDAAAFADRLRLPLAIMEKRRLDNSGRADVGRVIGDVEKRRAIILEDEIASGGTIAKVARALKDAGATRVSCACTHAVFGPGAVDRLCAAAVDEWVVTNTVPLFGKHLPNMTVLSVAPLLAQVVERVHTGASISSLFT